MEEIFVPGRTELLGNHTDHQGGRVVAATLDIGMRLRFEPLPTPTIRLRSEGYAREFRWPAEGEPHPSERMLGASLALGGKGWAGELSSELPSGGGLSSSAAFCILLLRVQEALGGLSLSVMERAVLARRIEVEAMGKPCGLMDQAVISAGGTVYLDFAGAEPAWEGLGPPPFGPGWTLRLVDTGATHEDLTVDYAAIPEDMRRVARVFGKDRLGDVEPARVLELSPGAVPSRSLQRALHFFGEQERVSRFREAWRRGDGDECLRMVAESGQSSAVWLQNLVPSDGGTRVADLFALIQTRRRVRGYPGAERIHGGGFGGYIQVYLPTEEEGHFDEWLGIHGLRSLTVWRT